MQQAPVADTAWDLESAERRATLRRMRRTATALLAIMVVAFALCFAFEGRLPWLAYPGAFAEAGIVGACADWFAVVAIFRRPFGLPIPHTAILPRNQQKLAHSLGVFVATNFLAPAVIAPRLERIDLAGWIADWLRDKSHVELVVECAQTLMSPALEFTSDADIREFARSAIRNGIDSIAAAPMAARGLSAVMNRGYHRNVYDFAVEQAATFLKDNRETILEKAAANSSSWLPRWLDSKAADAFITGLLEALREASAPDHPWRHEFDAQLDRLIGKLSEDQELYRKCEQIKSDILDAQLVDNYLRWLSAEAETRLKEELEAGHGTITRALEQALIALGSWLNEDAHIREMINRWSREIVLNAVVPNRAEIGAFVSDVIARWDSATLIERAELYVGRDLQFIRINGTVVGGLVGLLIFVLTKAIG